MTETLDEKICTPCRGGIPPLTREEAERCTRRAGQLWHGVGRGEMSPARASTGAMVQAVAAEINRTSRSFSANLS